MIFAYEKEAIRYYLDEFFSDMQIHSRNEFSQYLLTKTGKTYSSPMLSYAINSAISDGKLVKLKRGHYRGVQNASLTRDAMKEKALHILRECSTNLNSICWINLMDLSEDLTPCVKAIAEARKTILEEIDRISKS